MASPYRVKHKPSKRTSNKIKTLGLVLIVATVFAAFLYAYLQYTPQTEPEKQIVSDFPNIHAEDLGKTPKELKSKYPELFFKTNHLGQLVASHTLDGAQYIIWFVSDHQVQRAFRVKAQKTYSTLGEKEILDHFGHLYSRPFDTSCTGKTTYSEEKCHFKWWVRKSVSLDVFTRLLPDQSTFLSAITTDTYLTSKFHEQIKSVLPVQ
jgi:hypothetical protein